MKGMLIFMLDLTSPFSYENRDKFTFTNSEKSIVKQLEHLFENGNGINIIYGNRGVGKTTLKNFAEYKVSEKKYRNILFIDVPEYIEDTEFYSYILENLINQMNVKIEQIVEKYRSPFRYGVSLYGEKRNELDKIQLQRKLENLKSQIPLSEEWISDELRRKLDIYNNEIVVLQNNIDHLFRRKLWKEKKHYENQKIQINIERNFKEIIELKKWYQYEAYLSDLVDLQQIFDADVIDSKITEKYESEEQARKSNIGVSGKISIKRSVLDSNISIEQNRSIDSKIGKNFTGSSMVTHKLSFQYKKKKLTNILKNLQSELDLKINVCVDELDKHPVVEVSEIINRNKSFFLESGVTTFLILDLGNGILFKEKYSEYITSYILCKNLSIFEFLVKYSNHGKGIYLGFLDLLKKYCSIRGNNRNLLVKNTDEEEFGLSEAIVFVYLWQTDFYQKLPEDYKELFSNFFDDFVEHLKLLGRLEKSDFTNLVLEFKERYNISSVRVDLLFNQLEIGLYHNTLKQTNFFEHLWEYPYSKNLNELKFTLHEGEYFYKAFENYFNDTIVALKILIVEDFNLVLDCYQNNKINELFEEFLKKYRITKNDFMDIFKEVSGMKENFEFIRNTKKMIRYSDQDTSNGVDNAISTIDRWRNEIIGVVFFYPKNESGSISINGIIYRYNSFGEIICIPYMGSIGLHTHRPSRVKEFKQLLTEKNIKFIDIENLNEEIFQSAYEKYSDSEEEIIKRVCKENHYLSSWLKLIPID